MDDTQAMAEVILIQDGREVVLGRIAPERRCTLGLLDELARLQLVARGLGWCIVLEGAQPPLVELIELAGLSSVIPTRAANR